MRVFLPFAMGFYLSYLFRTISALIASPLTAAFALTPSRLSLLTFAYFLMFAMAQLPVGIALDRYGPRRVQSILLLVAAAGATMFAVSEGFLPLIVGRSLIGLGVAGALTAGLKASLLWFPKERLSLVNGVMVMVGALGAVTATTPSEWLLASIGWRGLFDVLAIATIASATFIYVLVPENPSASSPPNTRHHAGLRLIYGDPRFWRLAPLATASIGTAWSLQSLWAAPWLRDVEGLSRATLVHHLLAMALAVSLGAFVLGVAADRLRHRKLGPQSLFGIIAAAFIVIQLALILRWPLPSYVPWCAVAMAGAATILSYAAVAEYFPSELAGRANAALNIFHIGGAFLLQNLTGVILEHWPVQNGHYPVVAYQTAFAANVVLQAGAVLWFVWPGFRMLTARVATWLDAQNRTVVRARTLR